MKRLLIQVLLFVIQIQTNLIQSAAPSPSVDEKGLFTIEFKRKSGKPGAILTPIGGKLKVYGGPEPLDFSAKDFSNKLTFPANIGKQFEVIIGLPFPEGIVEATTGKIDIKPNVSYSIYPQKIDTNGGECEKGDVKLGYLFCLNKSEYKPDTNHR